MELPLEIRRFKEIREEQGQTQAEFAELLKIKTSTSDIERGRTKLSGVVVTELLKQFGINPLWLFGESNQKILPLHRIDTMPKVITLDSEEQENIVMVNQKAAAGYPHNVQDVEWYPTVTGFRFAFTAIPQCYLSRFSN